MIANTTKPLVLLVSAAVEFGPVLDFVEVLCGDLGARPFIIPYFNPVTPLVINAETSGKMFAAIDHGLPVIYSNYGMAGGTTPTPLPALWRSSTPSCWPAWSWRSSTREGVAVILGSLPASFDMRTMGSYYGPETMLAATWPAGR